MGRVIFFYFKCICTYYFDFTGCLNDRGNHTPTRVWLLSWPTANANLTSTDNVTLGWASEGRSILSPTPKIKSLSGTTVELRPSHCVTPPLSLWNSAPPTMELRPSHCVTPPLPLCNSAPLTVELRPSHCGTPPFPLCNPAKGSVPTPPRCLTRALLSFWIHDHVGSNYL